MPFPTNQDALFAAGYDYLRWENCPACGLCVEVWSTPGKREMSFDPMASHESPATQHFKTCTPKEAQSDAGSNIQTEVRRLSDDGRASRRTVPRDAILQQVPHADVPPEGQHQASSAQIKLHGLTDPNHNLLAAGWQDGTLRVKFSEGEGFHVGVPGELYIKMCSSRFALRQYNLTIKNKFPYTKVE